MRTDFRLLGVLLILMCAYLNMNAAEGKTTAIKLDKENHILIAPDATSYQWFINGVESTYAGRDIKIDAPGTYQVVMTNERGEVSTLNIKVGVTAEGEVYTIYLIGDSTVSDWDSMAYYPLTGWGQEISFFFDSNVIIENEAISGRSAKSFYNDHWAPIRDKLKPGDYVFVQFGINDAKIDDPNRYSDPFTTFQDYLTNFVTETQAKGAQPVLVSTLRRNAWVNESTVYDAYHDYPVATRQLATTLNVPLVDLDAKCKVLMESLGPDYVGPFMYWILEPGEYPKYPDGKTDHVHFQEMGAIEMARLVVESVEEYNEDTVMNKLIPHIKPRHKVAVSTNFPDETIFTRTTSYPEGVPITLKVKFDPEWDLVKWQNEQGEILSEGNLYMFDMGTDSLSVIAILDTVPVPDCAGEPNGKAYIDDCGTCVEGTTGVFACNSETTNGTYKLTSVRSELCIEEGEDITQENCTNENSQFWEIIKEDYHYKIKNVSSEKFLYCDALVSNTKVSTNDGGLLWRMEKIGTDTFQFVPNDNPDIVLDVFGATKPGVYLRLYKRTGGQNQKFILWELDPENCSGYPCVTSIEGSETYLPQFKIVPNPITSFGTLEFNTTPEYPITLEIYNLQGKKVFQKTDITDKRIEFGQDLSKGLYIVKVTVRNNIQILKLLKN